MNKLVATTLEAKFHVYDLRTHHPQKGFTSLSEKVHTECIPFSETIKVAYIICSIDNYIMII